MVARRGAAERDIEEEHRGAAPEVRVGTVGSDGFVEGGELLALCRQRGLARMRQLPR